MPVRKSVSEKMAEILSAISHPDRFRLIEELSGGEKDVHEIGVILKIPQPTVSQHLSVLRSQRLVLSRKEGRRVIYTLKQPWVAKWLLEGLKLLEGDTSLSSEIITATKRARKLWEIKN